MYPQKIRGVSKDKISQKADAIMKKLGIEHLANKNSREISAGEAQKTAIARAIVSDKDLMLLDEPIANIDKESIVLIEELLFDKKITWSFPR